MLERPENGARVRFDRAELLEGGGAIYGVRVWLPDRELGLRVELSEGKGAVVFEATDDTAEGVGVEPWLEKYLHSMARQLARADEWPRKLVQWHSGD